MNLSETPVYTRAFENWQQNIQYSQRMESLEEIVSNHKLSRRRRRIAWQQQKDLHGSIYGARLDSGDDSTRVS